MKASNVMLPRDPNPARYASTFRRSLRLAREAERTYRAIPTAGSKARRTDRILACLAVREKVRFARVNGRTDLRGAARLAALRRAARKYRAALARWAAYYRGAVSL